MENSNLQERAAKILDANEKATEVHFASDGTPFLRISEANGYAKKLDDKEVVTISKSELGGQVIKMEDIQQPEGKPEGKPLSKMNVEELKAEVAKREGLAVDEKATKKVMIEAIEAFDANATATAETAVTEPAKEEGNESGEVKDPE